VKKCGGFVGWWREGEREREREREREKGQEKKRM